MKPHRSRRDAAAAVRLDAPPAAADDQFIAVLANLAAEHAETGAGVTGKSLMGLRMAAAAGSVALVIAGGAYASGRIDSDPAPRPHPASDTRTPSSDPAPARLAPAVTLAPSPTSDGADDSSDEGNDVDGDVQDETVNDQNDGDVQEGTANDDDGTVVDDETVPQTPGVDQPEPGDDDVQPDSPGVDEPEPGDVEDPGDAGEPGDGGADD